MQVVETRGLELEYAADRMIVRVSPRVGRSLALFWKGLLGVVLFFGLVVAMLWFSPSHSPGDNISPPVLLGLYGAIGLPTVLFSLWKIRQDRRRQQEGCVFDRAANRITTGERSLVTLDSAVGVHTIVDKDQPVYVKSILVVLSNGTKIPVAPFLPLGGHYAMHEASAIASFLNVPVTTEARDYSPS